MQNPKSLPRRIDFLNTGLFFGQHKVMERVGPADVGHADANENTLIIDEFPMVGIIPELLSGCLPDRQGDILKQYIALHKEEIHEETLVLTDVGVWNKVFKRKTMCRNLFLPISIGGMGISPPSGFEWDLTINQMKLASFLYSAEPCLKAEQRPLRGFDVPSHHVERIVPWVLASKDPQERVYKLRFVKTPNRKAWKTISRGFLPYVTSLNHLVTGSLEGVSVSPVPSFVPTRCEFLECPEAIKADHSRTAFLYQYDIDAMTCSSWDGFLPREVAEDQIFHFR